MPTPLQGTSGSITVGGTNVVWAAEWTVTLTNNTETIGPHIGDSLEYDVNTSQKWEFEINGTVPSGGDPGQAAIMTAAANRTTPAMVFTQDNGRMFTFSAATFTGLEVSVTADGTQTWSASGGNGAGTVTPAQDT